MRQTLIHVQNIHLGKAIKTQNTWLGSQILLFWPKVLSRMQTTAQHTQNENDRSAQSVRTLTRISGKEQTAK